MTTPAPSKAELAALKAACAPPERQSICRPIRGVGKWTDYSIGTDGRRAHLLLDPANAANAVDQRGEARVIETAILGATEVRATLPAWDGTEHWRALPASYWTTLQLDTDEPPVLGVSKHPKKGATVYPLGTPRVRLEGGPAWRSTLRFGVEVRLLLDAIDWVTQHHAGAGVHLYSGHHAADPLIIVRAPLDVRRPLTPIRHIALVMPCRI